MDICFWVTNQCNLFCQYCYVDKSNEVMTLDIAKKAVEYVNHFFDNNEVNNVRFHGGEPLLNKEIIEYIIKGLDSQAENRKIHFYLTTNGTITEGIDYIANKSNISVSLDGAPHDNDRNRMYRNGKGTYASIDKFIKMMILKNMYINIRMTVHPNNVNRFSNNFLYIYSEYKVIPNFAFDYSSGEWSEELVALFFKELRKAVLFLLDVNPIGALELLDNLKKEYLARRSYCTAGKRGIHIAPSGKLFPCYLSVGRTKYIIGNIYDGLDNELVQWIYKESMKPNDVCGGCGLENNCKARSCKIINEIYTGNPFEPSAVKCAYTRGIYDLLVEIQKNERIKNVQVSTKESF